ncbi:ribonuclease H-like domain-containing protein, partial [Tanacetum coccineum]
VPSVHVGDGNSIPVTNTGHSIIPSIHRPLHLHNVLVTPNIIKNLISVRQFTRDNNCTIEFDAFGFSVKNFLTRHILLRCDSSGDLYPVTKPSILPTAFVSTSSSTWHQRLGHPEDEVLRSLTSRHFISCNKEKSTHVCHACQLGKHVKLPFHSSNSIVKQCFDIIHSDLWTSPIISSSGTESRLRPYHFNYPERSLTMEEMLNKFIDEGKREHEEMRAFIYDFQTNNELLFKERNNSLIELRFGVQELLKVINNIPMVDYDVKGVTTRGGKTTTQDVHDNDTNVLPKEPAAVEPEKPVGSNEVLTNDQPQTTSEPVIQPSNKVQTPPVPFPRRARKEKEEAQQKKFLENLKQIHINLPLIEALAQMPKYAKFLKGLLTNKARLEEACKIIMNERCSAVLLNKLPSKEKDPGSFTIPYDIGQLHNDNALANLGVSINLMPYTMYNKLDLGEPKATRMSLKLAD